MAAPLVHQSKATVMNALHEQYWHVLKSVLINEERTGKDASSDKVSMTEIVIKVQGVVFGVMVYAGHSNMREMVGLIDHNVIKLRPI